MSLHVEPDNQDVFVSSFDIVLEETLEALYNRRLEINKTLRSLKAKQRRLSQRRSQKVVHQNTPVKCNV